MSGEIKYNMCNVLSVGNSDGKNAGGRMPETDEIYRWYEFIDYFKTV